VISESAPAGRYEFTRIQSVVGVRTDMPQRHGRPMDGADTTGPARVRRLLKHRPVPIPGYGRARVQEGPCKVHDIPQNQGHEYDFCDHEAANDGYKGVTQRSQRE